jgi:hypothetical protein
MKKPTKADRTRLARMAAELERQEREMVEKHGPPEPRTHWAGRWSRINDAAAIRRVLAVIEAQK